VRGGAGTPAILRSVVGVDVSIVRLEI